MKYALFLLFSISARADTAMDDILAQLCPGQYVVVTAWRLKVGTWVRTSNAVYEITTPILDVLPEICQPLSLVRDDGSFVCTVRADLDPHASVCPIYGAGKSSRRR